MGGLLALKAAERMPISGLVLLSSELPRDLRPPARSYEIREVPDVYGSSVIGWATLPEKLHRDQRDLTLEDVARVQHMLGQKPHESGLARRQMLQGVPVDPRPVVGIPKLVVGAGARPAGAGRVVGAAGGVAGRVVRAVRGAFALRPGDRRAELPAGRRVDPGLPRGQPALVGGGARRGVIVTRLVSSRSVAATPADPAPHSSRGPGHRPLKAEITGSNPVCGTTSP